MERKPKDIEVKLLDCFQDKKSHKNTPHKQGWEWTRASPRSNQAGLKRLGFDLPTSTLDQIELNYLGFSLIGYGLNIVQTYPNPSKISPNPSQIFCPHTKIGRAKAAPFQRPSFRFWFLFNAPLGRTCSFMDLRHSCKMGQSKIQYRDKGR